MTRHKPYFMMCGVTVLLLCLTGCLSKQTSIELATSGEKASALGQSVAMATYDTFDSFAEAEILRFCLIELKVPSVADKEELIKELRNQLASSDATSSIRRIQRSLMLRHEMLQEVGVLYASWRALAEYGFGGSIGDHAKALAKIMGDYAVSTGTSQAEADALTNLVGKIAAAIANAIQRRELYVANAQFVELMPLVRERMQAEQKIYDLWNEAALVSETTVADQLWKLQIGQPDSYLASRLKAFGLIDYDPKDYRQLAKDRPDVALKIRAAVSETIKYRLKKELDLDKSVLASTIAALEKLEAAHNAIQADKGLDLNLINETLADLRASVDAAAAYAEARRAAHPTKEDPLKKEIHDALIQAITAQVKDKLGIKD